MEEKTFRKLENEIKELDLFCREDFHPNNHKVYRLKQTDYSFVIIYSENGDYYYSSGWVKDFLNKLSDASFEEVFENVPLHIKEGILFNLDLFRKLK